MSIERRVAWYWLKAFEAMVARHRYGDAARGSKFDVCTSFDDHDMLENQWSCFFAGWLSGSHLTERQLPQSPR